MASPITHNGTFTVKSTKTGEHRTFRVRTQPLDSNYCPGKRVLSLLTGSDNENSYTGFAFVDDFGIHVWGKKKTEQYLALATMLEHLQKHEDAGRVTVLAETTCRKCNRKLTTPESILSGIGPTCGGRDTETTHDRIPSDPRRAAFAKKETRQEQLAFESDPDYRGAYADGCATYYADGTRRDC